jgi:hypothetical protein
MAEGNTLEVLRRDDLTLGGGRDDQTGVLASRTLVDVALLRAGQGATVDGPFLAYAATGIGIANATTVVDGDLVRGADLRFEAIEDAHLLVVHTLD